jgi:hypothetical protein
MIGMMNARVAVLAAFSGFAMVLAGCQSTPHGLGRPTVAPVASSPFDGQWIGTDGVAVSTLRNGTFESRSVQTGEQLTSGTYSVRDQSTIDLDFYSIKSQKRTTAACLLVGGGNQMNCTLASGTRFVLNRRRA